MSAVREVLTVMKRQNTYPEYFMEMHKKGREIEMKESRTENVKY